MAMINCLKCSFDLVGFILFRSLVLFLRNEKLANEDAVMTKVNGWIEMKTGEIPMETAQLVQFFLFIATHTHSHLIYSLLYFQVFLHQIVINTGGSDFFPYSCFSTLRFCDLRDKFCGLKHRRNIYNLHPITLLSFISCSLSEITLFILNLSSLFRFFPRWTSV